MSDLAPIQGGINRKFSVDGGTGRRTGLKILRGFPSYGFDSRSAHTLIEKEEVNA